METGKKIKEYRKAAHKTQLELAEAIGVNRVTVTKYENGSIVPPIEKLGLIAAALNCSIVDLIDNESFNTASESEKTELIKGIAFEAGKKAYRTFNVAKAAGYEIFSDDKGIFYLTDDSSGITYLVTDTDLLNDALNSSTDFIDYNFSKVIKASKVYDK